MNPKQEKFLKNLQKGAESGAVQHEELLEWVQTLLGEIVRLKTTLDAALSSLDSSSKTSIGNVESSLSALEGDLRSLIETSKKSTTKEVIDLGKKLNSEIDRVVALIPDVADLRPLEMKIENSIAELEKKIPELPEEIKPTALRDKLESLPKGQKTKIEAIESLREELDELKNVARNSSSGGVTNLRIQQAFKYILKTEAPVGDIDGVNTTYTVSQPIFAVLAFSINGETIAQLPNYTIRGRQVVFSSALPAAYSGKDFEIKYV